MFTILLMRKPGSKNQSDLFKATLKIVEPRFKCRFIQLQTPNSYIPLTALYQSLPLTLPCKYDLRWRIIDALFLSFQLQDLSTDSFIPCLRLNLLSGDDQGENVIRSQQAITVLQFNRIALIHKMEKVHQCNNTPTSLDWPGYHAFTIGSFEETLVL